MYGGIEHRLLPRVPLPHVFSLHFIHLRPGPSLLASETEAKTLVAMWGSSPLPRVNLRPQDLFKWLVISSQMYSEPYAQRAA